MTGRVFKLIQGALIAACLLALCGTAQAKDNLCGECHTAKEIASFGNVLNWDRSIFQVKDTPCPGILELKRDAYFTESRLAKYDEFLTHLEHQTRRYPEYMKEELVKNAVKYADLASVMPTSIEAFTGPDLKIKKDMHSEAYEKLNKLRGDYGLEKVMGLALFGVLLVTFLMFLGLKNTLKE